MNIGGLKPDNTYMIHLKFFDPRMSVKSNQKKRIRKLRHENTDANIARAANRSQRIYAANSKAVEHVPLKKGYDNL